MTELANVSEDAILELRRAYRLSQMQGAMLRLLLTHNIVPSSLMAEHSGSNVGVAVFRLRQRLLDYKISVQSMRGLGFWLKPEDRDRLLQEAARTLAGAESALQLQEAAA